MWLYGHVAMWLCGCVAMWLCGCVAMWLRGCVAVWLSSYCELHAHPLSGGRLLMSRSHTLGASGRIWEHLVVSGASGSNASNHLRETHCLYNVITFRGRTVVLTTLNSELCTYHQRPFPKSWFDLTKTPCSRSSVLQLFDDVETCCFNNKRSVTKITPNNYSNSDCFIIVQQR